MFLSRVFSCPTMPNGARHACRRLRVPPSVPSVFRAQHPVEVSVEQDVSATIAYSKTKAIQT